MKNKSSEIEDKILAFINSFSTNPLLSFRYVTPTQIGLHLGKDYDIASSYACYHLNKMRKKGIVIRYNGKYISNPEFKSKTLKND